MQDKNPRIYVAKTFALLPYKMSDTKKYVWFGWYYKTVQVTEYPTFEEGIGDTTYRIYKTIYRSIKK